MVGQGGQTAAAGWETQNWGVGGEKRGEGHLAGRIGGGRVWEWGVRGQVLFKLHPFIPQILKLPIICLVLAMGFRPDMNKSQGASLVGL